MFVLCLLVLCRLIVVVIVFDLLAFMLLRSFKVRLYLLLFVCWRRCVCVCCCGVVEFVLIRVLRLHYLFVLLRCVCVGYELLLDIVFALVLLMSRFELYVLHVVNYILSLLYVVVIHWFCFWCCVCFCV